LHVSLQFLLRPLSFGLQFGLGFQVGLELVDGLLVASADALELLLLFDQTSFNFLTNLAKLDL
jgi:hypothetical protein